MREAQIARLARDGLSNPESAPGCAVPAHPCSPPWATSSASPRAASCAASCRRLRAAPLRWPARRPVGCPTVA